MARRRITEEHVNHERWLVSYADFITLLMAFFVVMYSISQVNESKYRVLSDTLEQAFNQPEFTLKPIQIGEIARSNPFSVVDLQTDNGRPEAEIERGGDTENTFADIVGELRQALGSLIDQGLISVNGNEEWLEIALTSSILFPSGEAELSETAEAILQQVAQTLKDRTNAIKVEGFTDNVPISNAYYDSNWELSAARATAVVKLLSGSGIEPQRLAAVGYGEYQPIADNASAEGRSKNRRIVLMVSRDESVRPQQLEHVISAEGSFADAEVKDVGAKQAKPTPPPAAPQQPEQPAVQAQPAPADSASETRIDADARERAEQWYREFIEGKDNTDDDAPSGQSDSNPSTLTKGVKAIKLKGGGILFTSEPEPSADSPQNDQPQKDR